MFLPTHYQPSPRERQYVMAELNGEVIAVEWPPDGGRARQVVTRSRARSTGKLPSWKLQRMMQWESRNERNAFLLLEAAPGVRGYREQPLTIRYRMDGEDHLHYPDILVEFADSRELWEVKPRKEAADPFVAARTQLMTTQLPRFGFAYRMVIAEELAREPRISLARDLLRFGSHNPDDVAREQVRSVFERVGDVHWGSAVAGDLGRHGRNALCRLTLEGRVHCESSGRLGPHTRFRWVVER